MKNKKTDSIAKNGKNELIKTITYKSDGIVKYPDWSKLILFNKNFKRLSS